VRKEELGFDMWRIVSALSLFGLILKIKHFYTST